MASMRHEWIATVNAGLPMESREWRLAVEGGDIFTDYGLGEDLVRTAAGAGEVLTELLRLAAEVEELQLTVACRDATLAMAASRLDGEVEGAPTARVNFLQRVDALREIEEERDRLAEENLRLMSGDWRGGVRLSPLERVGADRLADEGLGAAPPLPTPSSTIANRRGHRDRIDSPNWRRRSRPGNDPTDFTRKKGAA